MRRTLSTFTRLLAFDTIKGMGKVSKVLKRVLANYGISQNKLAVAMGIGRSSINRWVNENRDPGGDSILAIRRGLQKIDSTLAQEFIRLYLEESDENQQSDWRSSASAKSNRIYSIEAIGKAGKALRQVLETYSISQNKLAVTMGIERSTIDYWHGGTIDPSAETLLEIRKALRKINPTAAQDFIRLYLDESEESES